MNSTVAFMHLLWQQQRLGRVKRRLSREINKQICAIPDEVIANYEQRGIPVRAAADSITSNMLHTYLEHMNNMLIRHRASQSTMPLSSQRR